MTLNLVFDLFQYFPLPFWELISHQTNLYSVQKRDQRSVKTNLKESHLRLAGTDLGWEDLRFKQYSQLQEMARKEMRNPYRKRKLCSVTSIDIKNAFNSASW
uniref:Uncharacterized protein n=1 Tax=Cacopsylla melanoneura TaxID=428564 RepID=A0A8D8REU1_9HEMI